LIEIFLEQEFLGEKEFVGARICGVKWLGARIFGKENFRGDNFWEGIFGSENFFGELELIFFSRKPPH
jgi:hypothetical protein